MRVVLGKIWSSGRLTGSLEFVSLVLSESLGSLGCHQGKWLGLGYPHNQTRHQRSCLQNPSKISIGVCAQGGSAIACFKTSLSRWIAESGCSISTGRFLLVAWIGHRFASDHAYFRGRCAALSESPPKGAHSSCSSMFSMRYHFPWDCKQN
jgi:hypothetical protein